MANRMSLRRRQASASVEDEKTPLAEKMSEQSELVRSNRIGPLGVWTEGLWKREALVLRALEKGMLSGVERWLLKPHEVQWRENLQYRFAKPLPVREEPTKEGWVRRMWRSFRS